MTRLEQQLERSKQEQHRAKRQLAKQVSLCAAIAAFALSRVDNLQVAIRQQLMPGALVRDVPSLLNDAFVLEVCKANEPSDVSSLKIEDHDLDQADSASLSAFTDLVHVAAGGNRLQLADFATLPRLLTLELPLNFIKDINIAPQQLNSLTQLDLSHNTLAASALRELGGLRSLRSLNLTHNDLNTLPLDLAAPISKDDDSLTAFPCLENLVLDDNRLAGPSAFQALAGLPVLLYLSLNRNRLTAVPTLVSEYDDDCTKPFAALEELSLTENR